MQAPDPPAPPDPYATAAAQTASNVNTAVANTTMGNANERSNLGTVKYNVIGTKQIDDGQGKMIDVPQYERITELSPEQQKLYDQQVGLGVQMNDLAGSQLTRLGNTLSSPLDTSSLPGAAGPAAAPTLRRGYESGGDIQKGVNLQMGDTTFADVGGPKMNLGPQNYSYDAARASDAIMERMQPQMDQQRSKMEAQLANQGIARGSQAWRNSMDDYSRSVNDARLGAVTQGYGVANQLFGQNLASGQFENSAQQQAYDQARNRGLYGLSAIAQNNAAQLDQGQFANSAQGQAESQNAARAAFGNAANQQDFSNQMGVADFQNTARERALQEQLAIRNQPINEISALMKGGQVTMPTFTPYKSGTVDGTPVGQYVYDSANIASNNWRTQAQATAAENGALFSMGGNILSAGMKFSDARLKRDIARVGTGSTGAPLYFFRYVNDNEPRLGYMAQDVATILPDAVHRMPNGFYAVDYAKAVI